jgi:chromosome segregation ATPase
MITTLRTQAWSDVKNTEKTAQKHRRNQRKLEEVIEEFRATASEKKREFDRQAEEVGALTAQSTTLVDDLKSVREEKIAHQRQAAVRFEAHAKAKANVSTAAADVASAEKRVTRMRDALARLKREAETERAGADERERKRLAEIDAASTVGVAV